MKKQPANDFMGKHTGYQLIGGVYHIAPMYIDNFAKLSDRKIGIDSLMESVLKYAAEINRQITAERRELWQRIYEDLGLDPKKAWVFHSDGTISEQNQKKEV